MCDSKRAALSAHPPRRGALHAKLVAAVLCISCGSSGTKASAVPPNPTSTSPDGSVVSVVDGSANLPDGSTTPPGPSGLPAPADAGLAMPSGTVGNLTVLNWAGFKAAVSWTLDDSQPSQIDHWPELKAEGVRMTFYVNSSGNWYPGYDATWKDAVAQGNEIGNHTVNHCHADPTGCTNYLGSLDQEIDVCSTYIETRLDQATVSTFAYPFGDLGWEPYAPARFFLARGVNGGAIAPNDNTDPFNLPIIAASGGEAASVFNGDIDTTLAQGRWLIFLFHSILPTTQNWTAGVDISSITGSIEHAKGLSDVWIDSVVNIGAYWRAQKMFSALTPTTSGSSKTWTWSLPAHFPAGKYLRIKLDGGTPNQGAGPLPWDDHGYYEVALDAGTLTVSP
jgi:peptidoglycan/xylan/chitin deacetylase (PgdA/CDA1 family)